MVNEMVDGEMRWSEMVRDGKMMRWYGRDEIC